MLHGLDIDDQERVARYVERASADETLRAYRSDWAMFRAWCAARSLVALPATPATTAAFLTHLADHGTTRINGVGLARSSIGRRSRARSAVR